MLPLLEIRAVLVPVAKVVEAGRFGMEHNGNLNGQIVSQFLKGLRKL